MPFDLQPSLSGTLLKLVPLRETDFDALFEVASDPLIWEQHPDSLRYTEPVFRRYFDGAMQSGGAFLIRDVATDEIAGSSRYIDLRQAESQVEIGYTFLARKYWGGDYNRELKELMMRHAFRFVDTCIFVVGANNLRSRGAMGKIGGIIVHEGTSPAGVASVTFAIKRSEFERRFG